jgi:hypothetical protein
LIHVLELRPDIEGFTGTDAKEIPLNTVRSAKDRGALWAIEKQTLSRVEGSQIRAIRSRPNTVLITNQEVRVLICNDSVGKVCYHAPSDAEQGDGRNDLRKMGDFHWNRD